MSKHRMLAGGALCLLALLLVMAAPVQAEWQNFLSSTDGLPDNQVLSLMEDRGGSMWFGSASGATRYDGQRWATLRDSLSGLPTVRAMLNDRVGNYWFGTEGGLARFDGARWTLFAGSAFLPKNDVHALLQDSRGDLWIGTSGGLVRHSESTGSWTTYTTGDGLIDGHAYQVIEDRSHALWVGTPKGVSRLDDTRSNWQSFSKASQTLDSDSVFAVAEAADGAIWIGTFDGAYRYANGAWTGYSIADGLGSGLAPTYDNLPHATVTSLVRDPRGGMWCGGKTGLSHFDGRVWRRYPDTSDGNALQEIVQSGLTTDVSGNLWIATVSHGLFRYDGVEWRNALWVDASGSSVPNAPGVPNRFVLNGTFVDGLFEDHRGELWFATIGGGLNLLGRTGAWSPAMRFRRDGDISVPDSIRVMFEDGQGALWCGSRNSGVAVLDSNRTSVRFFNGPDELPSDAVTAIAEDSGHTMWVGTTNGVGKFDGTQWSSVLTGGEFGAGHRVDRIVEDASHRLWFKSSRGVYRLSADRSILVRISTADGLQDSVATLLQRGASGRIYVGTAHGLSVLDGEQWTRYSSFGAAGDEHVRVVTEDHRGRIWVGTNQGVAYLEGSQWIRFSVDVLESTPVRAIHEDRAGNLWVATAANGIARYNGDVWRKSTFQGDGLVSNSILSIVEDGQGHLWFVGSKGATEHEPDRAAPQSIILSAPDFLIPVSRVGFVFGAAYKESADLEFSSSLDDTIFACPNEAQSSCWSPRVSFSREDIPDGRHTFSVRARDWAHDVDPTSAVFHFEVDATPPDAQLSSLSFGQPVRGTIDLVGMADDARFKNYRVEVRPSGLASWSGSAVTLLDSSEVRVGNGRVASWNTLGFAEGLYDVRLAVRDTLGLLGVSQTTVQVDNFAPFADVTSPRRIPAAGGDIYSRLGEVHVFFPPGALVAGDSVIIVPADTATMAGSRVTGAFSIAWQGELSKPATLEFVPGDSITTLSSGPIAIRRLADDGSWTLVGGTRDPANGHVSAPLRAPGTYALVRDVATTIAGPSLSNLSMSPRALSLSGGFGSAAGIAIGFTLAQPGRATLRVYNRAGHFVRELANGMTMNAGANLVRWDGRDGDGNRVREGLYLVSVEALGQVQTRTVAVVP